MNERIQALARQSGATDENGSRATTVFCFTEQELKGFVELIVRECLSDLKERIALRYQGSDKDCDIGYGMEIVYYEIVDRFGVE